MARYSKTYSSFIIPEKRQVTTEGSIWWRDWTTIGERHRLEAGKKPYFGDAGFMFTENAIAGYEKRIGYGRWVGHYNYDDVSNATGIGSSRDVNRYSNDLRDYAYYGSCYELIRTSVENIVATFPGRIRATSEKFYAYYEGEKVDTGFYEVQNPFDIDMYHPDVIPSQYENYLRYMSYAFGYYDIIVFDANGKEISREGVTDFEVVDSSNEVPDGYRYHDAGYEYVEYNGRLFVWDCNINGFTPVEVDTIGITFGKEVVKYGGKYYRTVDGTLTPINVLTVCQKDYDRFATIRLATGELQSTDYYFYAYKVGGRVVYASATPNMIIQPKVQYIDAYFDTLGGFGGVLLTRDTMPLYSPRLIAPVSNGSNEYTYIGKIFTWPSEGYCINVDGFAFQSYVKELTEMGMAYDETHCDVIWRCMTHESIKNFDWSYRREYDDKDAQERIEGGDRMSKLLRISGRIFDDLKRYVDGIRFTNTVTYDGYNNTTNMDLSERNYLGGWDTVPAVIPVIRYSLFYEGSSCDTNYFIECPEYINRNIPESGNYITWSCGADSMAPSSCPIDGEVCEDNYFKACPEYVNRGIPESRNYIEWVCVKFSEFNPVEMSNLPCVATAQTPEYVAVGCNCAIEENSIYRKETALPDSIRISYPYLNGVDEKDNPYITKQNPWITRNANGYTYVKLLGEPQEIYTECEDGRVIPSPLPENYFDDKTFMRVPNVVTADAPIYIRIANNGIYTYYQRESYFNPIPYLHSNWYPTVNPEKVTAASNDIDFQRNLYLASDRIFGTKGTKESIDMVMALFGLGREDNGLGDYRLTEYYRETTPKSYDEPYYYYQEIASPSGTPTVLPSIPCNPTESDDPEIEVDGRYYALVGGEKLSDVIVQIFNSRMSKPEYRSYYSGIPINDITINNTRLLVPYYINGRGYDGGLYFQQQGGWGRQGNSGHEWMETISYLQVVPNFSALLTFVPNQLNDRDIFFVANMSDYMAVLPNDVSHFFVVTDKYNPETRSSWAYVPMVGPITTNANYITPEGATHTDYLKAIYLDSLVSTNVGNNPHCGFGRYDAGEEYFDYMAHPYRDSVSNYDYDDPDIMHKAEGLRYCIDRHVVTDDNISLLDNGKMFDLRNDDGKKYILNDKVFVLTNTRNNNLFRQYLREVVLNYVLQVIPSTAILILENFDYDCEGHEADMYNINVRVTSNDDSRGVVYGGGEYANYSTITISAVEKPGYHFVGWKVSEDAKEFVSTDMTYTVKVCGSAEYVAIFEEDCNIEVGCGTPCSTFISSTEPACTVAFLSTMEEEESVVNYFNVNVNVLPSANAGTVSFSSPGPYLAGSEVTITVTHNAGWRFVGWTDDSTIQEGERVVTVDRNLSLTVVFEEYTPSHDDCDIYLFVVGGMEDTLDIQEEHTATRICDGWYYTIKTIAGTVHLTPSDPTKTLSSVYRILSPSLESCGPGVCSEGDYMQCLRMYPIDGNVYESDEYGVPMNYAPFMYNDGTLSTGNCWLTYQIGLQ